jgi:hypothetical protein
MKKHFITTTASLVALVATSVVFAGDIYKWTDADGNVHYGDRPIEGAQPERLAIASQPTDPAVIESMTAARAKARTEAAETKVAAEGPSAEELRAEAEARTEQCASSRQQLQTFVTSRRLYREDEAGERVYLDEEQTLAARQRVEDQVTEYCNP